MKKLTLIQLFLLFSVAISAQIASGYYRIQNKVTDRYITVWDNTFTVNAAATDVDLSALVTIRDYNRIINDPGSIIYFEDKGNNNYILRAQGTNTYTASNGNYLKLRKRGDAYWAYVSSNGLTKYLADGYDPNEWVDQAFVYTRDDRTRDWYIKPINDTDNYLGLTPTITDGKHYYQTFYASFPFRIVSKEMKAYCITKVDRGMAVLEEIVGEVPAEMPILIKTTSNAASVNKLDVLVSTVATKGNNLLKGNYFNYSTRKNQTPYKASTMRMLGVLDDGSIGFIKDENLEYLPANKAYLPVPADCADNVKLVTKAEYDAEIAAAKKENEDAYTRLNQEIAKLQAELDAAKETINTECKDVAAQFTEQIANIQNSIHALTADVKAKYEAVKLDANSKIETASISASIQNLISSAKNAQALYEAGEATKLANEIAYARLTQEITELQASLDLTTAYISTECKDVAENYVSMIANIQNSINNLQKDVDTKYANAELTAESTINTADIVAAIEAMKNDATEAQKKHEATVGIYGVDSNGAKLKAIYSLDGKKVSNTKPGNIYIFLYETGRIQKVLVR